MCLRIRALAWRPDVDETSTFSSTQKFDEAVINSGRLEENRHDWVNTTALMLIAGKEYLAAR